MAMNVMCILTLERSIPAVKTSRGGMWKLNAAGSGVSSGFCACSSYSDVLGLECNLSCEGSGEFLHGFSKVKVRKKNTLLAKERVALVQVVPKESAPGMAGLAFMKVSKASKTVQQQNLDTFVECQQSSAAESVNLDCFLAAKSSIVDEVGEEETHATGGELSTRLTVAEDLSGQDMERRSVRSLTWIRQAEENCSPAEWVSELSPFSDGNLQFTESNYRELLTPCDHSTGNCGDPIVTWRRRGWRPSPLQFRRKCLTFSLTPKVHQTRLQYAGSRPMALTVAAATTSVAGAHSPSALDIEETERYDFTSIPAGDAGVSSTAGRGRRRKGHSTGARRGAAVITRDKGLKKKVRPTREHKEDDGAKVGGNIEGSLTVLEDLPETQKAYTIDRYQPSDKERQQPRGLWVKKMKSLGLQKVPVSKIDTTALSTLDSCVNEVMQALGSTASSQGVSKVMTKFGSKLTIQDLKQLLTELGIGPERNWARAVQVFDWMHDMGVYDIDGAMYHSMIVLLGKSRKMDIAESMVERMKTNGLTPDSQIYTALVGGYVRSGNISRGIAVLTEMKANGQRPSLPAYNVLIDGCLKVPKGLELAKSLMRQMKQDGINPDRVSYTTMIIMYTRRCHHVEAIKMFQEMLQRKCVPDILTYNAVLNAYAKLGDIQRLLEGHQSMAEHGVVPDTITFNIILNALGRAGRSNDVSDFYKHMRKVQVAPDVTTCCILVNAHGKAGAWDELDLLIAEMERLGLQPDLTVYNSLISIYGKAARFEQVELIVKTLQSSSGMLFDVVTYNTLIDIYGKVGRLSDVIKWFSEMRKQNVKPDVRTFNALVYAYGRASQYEGVKEILNLFRAGGSAPDLVFYHTLLFMFAKGAKYDDAWGVIEDMQQQGYTLTLDIYNSLLLVFGRSNAQEAVKLYCHMISSRVRPNSITFKTLVEVHARKGMVDECIKIYKKAKDFLGNEPVESLLSSVCGACCNMRRTEEAENILMELETQGYQCSVACFNWLVLGYGRQGLWKKAEQILEGMSSKGLLPNPQSYNFLLEAYSLYGLYDKASSLKQEMEKHGLISSASAYNCLIRYHVRCGRVDLALQTLEDLQNNGLKANHNTYAALLSGYGGQDESLNEKIFANVWGLGILHLDPKHGIYTALLAAIPRCKSQKEAHRILHALERLDCPSEILSILKDAIPEDNQEEAVWERLADRFRYIDMNGFNLETQRNLQNALIDALWWFGWEIRALKVVRISMDLGVLGQVYTWSELEWTLNLSNGSVGAAQILLLMWITSLRKLTIANRTIPPLIRIILAEEWQLRLDENKAAIDAVEAHLVDLGAAYSRTDDKTALEMSGEKLSSWLRQGQLDRKLFLIDSLVKN